MINQIGNVFSKSECIQIINKNSFNINPNSKVIKFLKRFINKINWHCLCLNKNKDAIQLLIKNPNKIN